MSEKRPQIVNDLVLAKEVAALYITGATNAEIAKGMKERGVTLSRYDINDITESDAFRQIIMEYSEKAMGPAIAKAKARMSRLLDKAVKVIERVLDEGDDANALKAASMVFKSAGLEEQSVDNQDTNITVVLPGSDSSKTIEVESKEI